MAALVVVIPVNAAIPSSRESLKEVARIFTLYFSCWIKSCTCCIPKQDSFLIIGFCNPAMKPHTDQSDNREILKITASRKTAKDAAPHTPANPPPAESKARQ